MKNLAEVTVQEQLEFINSFDHVLCDMDGVIWMAYEPLPGAKEALRELKKIGKTVHFVSNNDVSSRAKLSQGVRKLFGDFTEENIAQPVEAIIDYLKNIKFDKELYLVSSKIVRKEFEEAGFKLADKPPQEVDESVEGIFSQLDVNENVGCVVNCTDFNLTYMKLQKCLTYLKRPDCLWIVGPPDTAVPIGPKGPLMGPHYLIQALKAISGREYVQISKPTKEYNEFFVRQFNLQNPSRVLFIGDTIDADMKMAAVGGYKKLLVFTGIAQLSDVQNWTFDEELKPDYYIESLHSLRKILENLSLTNKC